MSKHISMMAGIANGMQQSIEIHGATMRGTMKAIGLQQSEGPLKELATKQLDLLELYLGETRRNIDRAFVELGVDQTDPGFIAMRANLVKYLEHYK